MAERIAHPIFSAIDRYFDAERQRIEAERDLAKLAITWLASRDHHVEAARPIAPAQGDDVELLNTSQLAKRLNYSTRTIQQFKSEGMPCVGEGRATRFELSKALEWLRTHRGKKHRVSTAGNGKVSSAPIKTRLQAAKRI
jgi:phage terminase Nu1 subunit (DNA packaging protein)